MYPQTRQTRQEHFSDLTNQTMIPESGITEWTHPPPFLLHSWLTLLPCSRFYGSHITVLQGNNTPLKTTAWEASSPYLPTCNFLVSYSSLRSLFTDYLPKCNGGAEGVGGVREVREAETGRRIPKVTGSGRKREKLCNTVQYFAIEIHKETGANKYSAGTGIKRYGKWEVYNCKPHVPPPHNALAIPSLKMPYSKGMRKLQVPWYPWIKINITLLIQIQPTKNLKG